MATRKRTSGSGTRKVGHKYVDRNGFAYTYRLPDAEHCNGWNPQNKSHCGNRPGVRTDHPGEGRCYRHKGREPQHGNRSARLAKNLTLQERALKAQKDPNLTRVEKEAAWVNTVVDQFLEGLPSNRPLDDDERALVIETLRQSAALKQIAHQIASAWTDRRAIAFMDYLRQVVRESLERNIGTHPGSAKVLFDIAEQAERFKA